MSSLQPPDMQILTTLWRWLFAVATHSNILLRPMTLRANMVSTSSNNFKRIFLTSQMLLVTSNFLSRNSTFRHTRMTASIDIHSISPKMLEERTVRVLRQDGWHVMKRVGLPRRWIMAIGTTRWMIILVIGIGRRCSACVRHFLHSRMNFLKLSLGSANTVHKSH